VRGTKRSSGVRWVLIALVAMLVCGGLGVLAGRHRARGETRTAIDGAAPAGQRVLGQALREAIGATSEGDAARAEMTLTHLRQADPANGYVETVAFAARVVASDYAGAQQALDAALAQARWTTYVDALGLPSRLELDQELAMLRNAEAGYRLAVLSGSVPGGSKGLVRLREWGLRVASVEPPDMVHLRAGATFRLQASDELLALARKQKDPAMVARFEKQDAADRAWREKLDGALLDFVRGRPGVGAELTESLWLARVEGEEQLVRKLLTEAPR
jgi:hypothetical protein